MRNYELKWNTRYEREGNTHPYVFHYVMRKMYPPAMPPAASNPIASDSSTASPGSSR